MSSAVCAALETHETNFGTAQQMVAWTFAGARSLTLMLGEKERRERFAYALQMALRARDLSERQLALKMQVDPRKIARWRSGKGIPDYYETLALAEVLNVSESLFRDPPAVPPPPPEPYYPIEDYLIEAGPSGAEEGHRRASTRPAAPAPDRRSRTPERSARASGER